MVVETKLVPREEIDRWPVAKAGFNARVTHCFQKADVRTVGDARRWSDRQLLRLRSFGVGSLENVHTFFRWARRLESGRRPTLHLRALMREFLNEQEVYVIEQRYGLRDPLFRPQMKRRTLQAIANQSGGLTRERVRQVEESALTRMRSNLCMAVADSLTAYWQDRILARGGMVPSSELGEWVGDRMLGGYQPWGALLFLSESQQRILDRYDCFTCLSAEKFDRIEHRILRVLEHKSGPVALAELVPALAGELGGLPDAARFLTVLLDHHPQIDGLQDRRYFIAATGIPKIILSILSAPDGPMQYVDLTHQYNERMLPQSRRSPAYIQYVLTKMPEARRVGQGLYQPATR